MESTVHFALLLLIVGAIWLAAVVVGLWLVRRL